MEISITPIGTGASQSFSAFVRDITGRKLAQSRLQAQLDRLNLLDQITRAIGERHDLQSIYQVTIRTLEERLPADFSCICLHDAANNLLTVAHLSVRNRDPAIGKILTEQATIEVDSNGLSRCLSGQLVYEPDIRQVSFPFPQRLAQGGLCSLVMAPLQSESLTFGILLAARRDANGFSSGECEFLRQLSAHIALATHQAQLYGALQQAYEDLRQSQHAVVQQERMSALGQMASGIAHDINNALSPVALYLDMLLEREPQLSSQGREQLGIMQRALDDVGHTISRMREFYGRREVSASARIRGRQSQCPAGGGPDTCALARPAPAARRRDRPPHRAGPVAAQHRRRRGRNPRCAHEFVFNAVDAMPEGGTLTLRTALKIDAVARYVVFEVSDTGVGMDEATRRRCLEPFFTTKGDRGTGLGLAMVYGTVRRHGADLEIDSTPGSGTTVRLIFAAASTDAVSDAHSAAPIRPTRRLRLLIVDDDPLLIQSLHDTLTGDGHAVTVADGGQAGIDAFRAAQIKASRSPR